MTIADFSTRVRWTTLTALLAGAFFFSSALASSAAGTATLVWNPSPSTNTIADYKIYYGGATGTYTNALSAGTGTTLTVSNLVQGATYYFVATAVDTFGLESDYSSEASALIPVNNPNQPPTLDPLVNLTFDENVGPQTVNLSGITSGATNEIQTLTVTAASGNASLVPTPTVNYTSPNTTGSISFTPALFAHGSATITVTVDDGCASNNLVSRAFDVTVNPVNHAPTLNSLPDLTLDENSGLQFVTLSGIGPGSPTESQTLTVTASSSNPGLIPAPTVSYINPDTTASLAFTPVPSAYGSAAITVTVNDGGASNNIASRTFTVTVNPVNQPPTLNPLADLTISENVGLQTVALSGISPGAANEDDTLVVTASSSDTGLIPAPAVNYTSPGTIGSIAFAPLTNTFGAATLTVTVNDGAPSNNIVSRSFTVTVNQVNPRPDPCAYALRLSPDAFTANATLGTFRLGASSECAWEIVAPAWVSIDSTNGSGPYIGSFSVEANTGPARTGLVTVIGSGTNVSCTITQQAVAAGAVALAVPLDGATLSASPAQFSWVQSGPPATKYYLVLSRDGSEYLTQWVEGATNWTAPPTLLAGDYTWAVETWTEGGAGPWSTNSSFTVPAGLPNTIALVSPSGTAAVNGSQQFTWTVDPAATRYELVIERDGSVYFDRWFEVADSFVGGATFSVDLTGISTGTYYWWVRGSSPAGDGPWSERMRVFLSRGR